MKKIELKQDKQPDGTVVFSAKTYCENSPCSTGPDICPHLHSNGVTEEGELNWVCNRE
jgi:hypothetical protein